MLTYKNNDPYIEDTPLYDLVKVCETPFYVYSQERIINQVNKTKEILGNNIFYSIKSNSNQAILKLMNSLDIGADVVSVGELKRALEAGFDPNKIIFEGVGKSEQDLLFAIHKNIRLINTESLEEIKLLNNLANEKNRTVDIGVRLNPNIDGETLSKISTGKKTDKFGIELNNIDKIIELVKSCKSLNLIGISCHIGSQISKIDAYKNTFHQMKMAADKFIESGINIKNVDLGGGFYVKYEDSDPNFNIKMVKEELNNCFAQSNYELSFEPGRYLIASAGVIVTSILTIKNNGGINYLIVDAGMNTLIRPAMYGAHHDILAINLNSEEFMDYAIAGPICESSDIFLKNIKLAKQKIGNLLVIKNTGAYGKVMSSSYNSRPLPSEILINKNNYAIIYSPEKIENTIDADIIPSWL
ncbi:diaminopimelate decarboxylase [Pelagibacteraceae bacterium]|nr:diaminopimelate decarboxylase [Pelagibacteraceae bacterium]